MRGMLSPSLMCADPLNVQQELTVLDDLGVDYIHLDFMDNHFVPNLTLSPELIKATKKVLRHMKRDIHIMAVEPQQYFDRMDIGEGDIVAVHYEACPDLAAVLADIRQRGATPAIALSPDTEPEVLTEWLGKIGMVLVMTVNPGFAGQKLIPATLNKIARLRRMLEQSGHGDVLIEVDGNVSFENAVKMHAAGADVYVAGSSSVFAPGATLEENVRRFRDIIEK